MARKRTILNLKEPQMKSAGWLLLLALAGALLILVGGALGRAQHPTGNALAVSGTDVTTAAPARTADSGEGTSLSALERELSLELERILSRVSGAGRVSVSVSLLSGPRVEYGANVQTSERTTQENDKQGGVRTITEKTTSSQPVVLRPSGSSGDRMAVASTQRAEIAGVLVVSEGAGDSRVRDELTRACMTLLDLPAHRIKVVQGKVGE